MNELILLKYDGGKHDDVYHVHNENSLGVMLVVNHLKSFVLRLVDHQVFMEQLFRQQIIEQEVFHAKILIMMDWERIM